MIALSKNPKPTKGIALLTATKEKQYDICMCLNSAVGAI